MIKVQIKLKLSKTQLIQLKIIQINWTQLKSVNFKLDFESVYPNICRVQWTIERFFKFFDNEKHQRSIDHFLARYIQKCAFFLENLISPKGSL